MHCHLHLDSPSLLPCKALPAGQLRDKLSPVRDSSTALFMLLRESCTHAQIALVHSSVPAARQIIVQPCALQQGIGGPSHAWYARATCMNTWSSVACILGATERRCMSAG